MKQHSALESQYATLKALYYGTHKVTTKNSEVLFFTSRIANTILDIRHNCNIAVKTHMEHIDLSGKKYGIYQLANKQRDNERIEKLLKCYKELIKAKFTDNPVLLKLYLQDEV